MSDNFKIKSKSKAPLLAKLILRSKTGKLIASQGVHEGYRRAQNMRMTRGYNAGDITRLTSDWPITWLSPDATIRVYLMNVRDRMRDLQINDAKVRRIIRLYQLGTVGPYGFKLKVMGRDPDGTLDTVGNQAVEQAWKNFCQKGNCTVDGRSSMRDVDYELAGDEVRDGEACLRFIHDPKFQFGMKLDIVPSEWIDIWYNVVTPTGGLIKMGVEMDAWNRPIAYWIRQPDPATELTGNFMAGRRTSIPAEDFILGYHKEYAHHTRAVSRLSQVAMLAQMRYKYQEATVVRARGAASTDGWLEQGDDSLIDVAWDDVDAQGRPVMVKEPGQTKILPKNTKFVPNDASYPDSTYDPFMRNMNEEMASGSDLPYSAVTGDLSRGNFSSDRAGKLDVQDTYRENQQWMIETFKTPVYLHWLNFALLAGQIQINNKPIPFKHDKFSDHRFTARGWDYVNPLQDVNAKMAEEGLILSSASRDAAERGDDWHELLQERVGEFKAIIDECKRQDIDPILVLAGMLPREPKGALPTNFPEEATGQPAEQATGKQSIDLSEEEKRLRRELEKIFSPDLVAMMRRDGHNGNGKNHDAIPE